VVLDPMKLEAGLARMDTTEPFEIRGQPPAQRDNNCFTNEMEGGGRT
jgi:hypothetical protein